MLQAEIEENQIRMRARRERRKVLEKHGLEYYSDEEEMKKRYHQDTDLGEYMDFELEDDDCFVEKQVPLSPVVDKIKIKTEIKTEAEVKFEEDELEMDDLFIEKREPSEEITGKSESSPEVDRQEEVQSTSNQAIGTNDQTKKTITRCTLYRTLDPRNYNANAILKCPLCLERGEMRLYGTEDALLEHMVLRHQNDID